MKNRKFLSLFTTFTILMSLVGVMPVTTTEAAEAVSPGTIASDQTWEEQTLEAGTYTIKSGVTVTVTGRQTIDSGTVIINGGGKIVRADSYKQTEDTTASHDSSMFYVNGSGTLTFDGSVIVDGQNIEANGQAINMYSGSPTVNLNGNSVLQNHKNINTSTVGDAASGGINVKVGTLNINGGTIKNCRTSGEVGSSRYTHAGGAIYLKGTCNMTSGNIINNYASNGGAIYLGSSGASLNITGGTISGNTVPSDGLGSGIYYSTLYTSTSVMKISGDANISDIIHLDNTSGELYPEITSKLKHNLTLSCSSREEGKVLAGGKDYDLTEDDAAKIFMQDTTLKSALNSASNQIILITEAHTHSLVKHDAVSATCTKTGIDEYWKCEGAKGCNKIFRDSGGSTELSSVPTTAAKDHNLSRISAKAATCTEAGNIAFYTCSNCQKWFTDDTADVEITDKSTVILLATKHDWDKWTITTEPTLYDKGSAERICKTDSAHKVSKELPALNDTSVWTVGETISPTENSDGSQVYTSDYGTVTVVLPAIDHSLSLVPAKAATCTETGNTAYYACSGCQKWFTDDTADVEITDKSSMLISANGHNWGSWTITMEPTFITKGSVERICKTDSAHKESKELPALSDTSVWTAGVPNLPTEDTDGSQVYTSDYGTVTIVLPASKKGTISTEITTDENVPATRLSSSEKELLESCLSEEEKQQIQNGVDIKIILTVTDADNKVSTEDKAAITAVGEDFRIGQYLDISLLKRIGDSEVLISETKKAVKITIDIPEKLKNTKRKRSFVIIRVHNGKSAILKDEDTDDSTITIETDQFSTYALAYQDEESASVINPVVTTQKPTITIRPKATQQPTATAKPDNHSKKGIKKDSSKKSNPETGDSTPIELYATTAMVAGLLYLLLYFRLRRTRKDLYIS